MRVSHDSEQLTWDLTWADLRYRLRLQSGALVCEYFGPADRYSPPTEWPVPDPIQTTRTEGRVGVGPADRAVSWSLVSWNQPDPNFFTLTLAGDLRVRSELRVQVDEATGLLIRSTTLHHAGGPDSIQIASAQSVAALMPADIEILIHLAGRLVAENQMKRQWLTESPIYLESRAGKTGYRFAPYVALTSGSHTYFCELDWSGNWQLHVERQVDGKVHLAGGLNPWGLRHHLQPGEELVLPEAIMGCVRGDLNAATQRLHDLRRARRPNPARPVPVHFNTWYPAVEFVPFERAKEYAHHAADLGCDLLVVDAGWYRKEVEVAGDGWWRKTGDWIVDERMYPDGMEALSEVCRSRGIGLGIWFEPEAVGVNAWVRRHHPEWLHAVGGVVPREEDRAILHLGVPDAREFIRERILDVLRRINAVWMKWDFNTDLDQGGWSPGLPDDLTTQDPLIAHYRGLNQLQDEIRAAMPDLTLEMCAGGGSRVDGAIMRHAHVNWMSDQTQALVTLAIHFGSHLAHPAIERNAWLVEWPAHDALHGRQWTDERGDLAFRTLVAMLGSFGVSAPVERWSEEDKVLVREHIAWYKRLVQPLVQTGNHYLLTPPPPVSGEGDWAAAWYVAKDASRGVVLAFRLLSASGERTFALPGVDLNAGYAVTPFGGERQERTGVELSAGLKVTAPEHYRSALVAIERI